MTNEYFRKWYAEDRARKIKAKAAAAPLCPCGCGAKLQWVPTAKRFARRATRACPIVLQRPLCRCGCGEQVKSSASAFHNPQCLNRFKIAQRKVRDTKMRKEAPMCSCGRAQMVWNRGRYWKCSASHHGVSARDVKLTEMQKQLILGTLLGDAYAGFVRNRVNARLRIRHSTKRQLPYCLWKWFMLLPITNQLVKVTETPEAHGKEIAAFNTLSHPFILEQALKLYVPKKTVNREYLDQLDAFGLAVWYMDDGSSAALHTQSFTDAEQQIIVDYLLERWGVEARVAEDRRRNLRYISFNHPRQMHDIVRPHVLPSLMYKLDNY